jgi:hypothetical protein
MEMSDANLINTINNYADEYTDEAVLEEFFGDMTIGEIIVDMWNAGLIPVDKMEEFLLDD